jgi:nitroreductase
MELREALRNRRSVRAFRPDPVPEETLRDLVEIANWAPSAGNLQSRDFILVRDPMTRKALAVAARDQEFLAEAPAVVVVCANARRVEGKYGRRGRDLYMIQDAAAATQNLMLAAHAAGLGTCWVGAFDEAAVRELLGIPAGVRPVALVPVGRPAETPEPPSRLPLTDVLHWDRW